MLESVPCGHVTVIQERKVYYLLLRYDSATAEIKKYVQP